jgi:hypothetical protein
MKKPATKRKATGRADVDEILPEYDFSRSSPNKYASRYAEGLGCAKDSVEISGDIAEPVGAFSRWTVRMR